MAKIFISSTYEDLKSERGAVTQAVRRLGHTATAMEDDVASGKRPVDKCLEDVRNCDAYVGIFAWRYGFIPRGHNKSMTHLEYEEAKKAGKECLIFLLDVKAPWPGDKFDRGEAAEKIDLLRKELKENHRVSFFNNADELGSLVSPAVIRLNLEKKKTLTISPGKPRLGPLVHKMCDRLTQLKDFLKFFQEKSRECPKRPQFYFIHGDELEGHDSLLQVLVNTCLKDHVERQWGSDKPKPYSWSVTWPKEGSLGDRKEQLPVNLMAGFQTWGEIDDFTVNTLARLPCFNKYPLVLIIHTLSDSIWDNTTEQLIAWYIREYWAALEWNDDIPHFLVFFNVKYSHPGKKGLKQKIFKWKYMTGELIRRRLEHIITLSDEKCPCRLIKELTPVGVGDIREWFNQNRIYESELKRWEKARAIFRESGSMSKLEENLRKIIIECQKSGEVLLT